MFMYKRFGNFKIPLLWQERTTRFLATSWLNFSPNWLLWKSQRTLFNSNEVWWNNRPAIHVITVALSNMELNNILLAILYNRCSFLRMLRRWYLVATILHSRMLLCPLTWVIFSCNVMAIQVNLFVHSFFWTCFLFIYGDPAWRLSK